jgi:hypothetical protein
MGRLIAFIQKYVIDAILVIVAMVCFGLAIPLYRAKKERSTKKKPSAFVEKKKKK